MQFNITVQRDPDDPKSAPLTVGWLRATDKGGVLYDPPERVIFRAPNRSHAKSASRCPAVIALESRYFMVKCPFDLHIGFTRDEQGRAVLVNRAGQAGAVRTNKLNEVLSLVAEQEWRYPDRPTVQLTLPYIFVADELVYMTQLDAFAHYRRQPLPGTIFGGRFPINLWPRQIMWAFEWHEPERDLILRRGDPLFYVQFEGDNPERAVQLVQAERTPELESYIEHVAGAVNYVNQTFSLFKAAEAARPAQLVTPKSRG
ncbi:hypothetical protein [Paracoccus sp. (in: a-proteobacteria)]|uniref:hypothetical protein n=1 Tax=Paracoccus sp. TaxID=267 RepID=UPI0026DEEDE5|nr:hypothetical protein [Paracoccus sp. (in: a-proteobacteria)]MDO5647732.1 hypothetical protein [Paracoccus sp. (in: a-proteobacteria)]